MIKLLYVSQFLKLWLYSKCVISKLFGKKENWFKMEKNINFEQWEVKIVHSL